jgi:hypothetical protein
MKQEAGMAWNRKRKKSNWLMWLQSMDQGTEVVLAAKPAIQLVCSTNVMCHIGIALEYTA